MNLSSTLDRFDVCAAYMALENDWGTGGWLQELPSNQRRMESIGVQLRRIGFRPAGDVGCAFEALENDYQRDIYCRAMTRFGLDALLSEDDDGHAPILRHMRVAD